VSSDAYRVVIDAYPNARRELLTLKGKGKERADGGN
jgi:hypothetical protein